MALVTSPSPSPQPADGEARLLIPFVTVASKGGPHDDSTYVAGYEMGKLDGWLESMPTYHAQPVQTVNRLQADLIAMHHGYTMRVLGETDDWLDVEFSQDWDWHDRIVEQELNR